MIQEEITCPFCQTRHVVEAYNGLDRKAADELGRFLPKVQRTSGCWIWKGARNNHGYGTLHVNGRDFLAHRFSYTLFRSKIPQGLLVLHHCDNPSCVNPSHLFLGDAKENGLDCNRKGRRHQARGEANHSKLKANAVREMRRRYAMGGASLRQLGREYGVSYGVVRNIIRRIKWAWLGD